MRTIIERHHLPRAPQRAAPQSTALGSARALVPTARPVFRVTGWQKAGRARKSCGSPATSFLSRSRSRAVEGKAAASCPAIPMRNFLRALSSRIVSRVLEYEGWGRQGVGVRRWEAT